MQWYYLQNGRQVGPVEEAEFFKLGNNRTILPGDLVWNESMGETWVRADSIRGLIPTAPAPVMASIYKPRSEKHKQGKKFAGLLISTVKSLAYLAAVCAILYVLKNYKSMNIPFLQKLSTPAVKANLSIDVSKLQLKYYKKPGGHAGEENYDVFLAGKVNNRGTKPYRNVNVTILIKQKGKVVFNRTHRCGSTIQPFGVIEIPDVKIGRTDADYSQDRSATTSLIPTAD